MADDKKKSIGGQIAGSLMGGAGQAVDSGIGFALNALTAGWQDRRQLDQARKLQDLQIKGSKEMGKFQNEMAMDLWNRTNYGAQVEHLKKAGLNPGLLYGGSGGGGTTSGAGGGSVSGQSATGTQPMDLMMLKELKLKDAQMALIDAQARDVNADADIKEDGGKDKQRWEIRNLISTNRGIELANDIRESNRGLERAELETRIDKMVKDMQVADASIDKMMEEIFVIQTENELKQKQIEMTDAQISKMHEDVKAMWKGLELDELTVQLNAVDLSRKDRELAERKRENGIKLFSEQVKEKYPNVMNLIGGAFKNTIDFIDQATFDIFKTETRSDYKGN